MGISEDLNGFRVNTFINTNTSKSDDICISQNICMYQCISIWESISQMYLHYFSLCIPIDHVKP